MKNVIAFFLYTGKRDKDDEVAIATSWANFPYDKPLRSMLPRLAGESYAIFSERGDEMRTIIALLIDDGEVIGEVGWSRVGLDGEWCEPTIVRELSE